jgi:hypothetical protein
LYQGTIAENSTTQGDRRSSCDRGPITQPTAFQSKVMIATLQPKPIVTDQRLRLSCIPWDAYIAFGELLGESHVRVTYDQGEMEVMSVSRKHERGK